MYQCDLYVNGLPQSTIHQELVVVRGTQPHIYNRLKIKFPEDKCWNNDKDRHKSIELEMRHAFGNTDSMNKYFKYGDWYCATNPREVSFKLQPVVPLNFVMEARSTPEAVMEVGLVH